MANALLQTMASKVVRSKSKLSIKAFTFILLVTTSSYLCLNQLEGTTNTAMERNFRELSSSSLPLLPVLSNGAQYDDQTVVVFYDQTVVAPENRKSPDQLRYAAWGSSVTWGAGVGHGSLKERKTFAYPWLLSPDATNFAIRAGGPQFPSACTSTMTGTEVFDVVVFEYYLMAEQGLQTLARRTRERFPDALIIFMVNWYPLMISRCKDEDCRSAEHITDYVNNSGFDMKHGGLTDPKVHELFEDSEDTFTYNQFTQSKFRDTVSNAAREVGGYVVTMPAPKDARHWPQYADLFAMDGHHLSVKGHREAAERVREIVDWHGVRRHPRLHKFMHQDHCINWFESGNTDGIEYSPNGVVEKMPGTEKFTLSFVGGDGGGGGWIKVRNPDDKPLALHIGYMTSGPPPSLYPKTAVVIEGIDDNSDKVVSATSPIMLDMNSDDRFMGRDVHISTIVKVGLINPGESYVRFQPLEETERPFRLVSVLVMFDDEKGALQSLGGNLNHAKNNAKIEMERKATATK